MLPKYWRSTTRRHAMRAIRVAGVASPGSLGMEAQCCPTPVNGVSPTHGPGSTRPTGVPTEVSVDRVTATAERAMAAAIDEAGAPDAPGPPRASSFVDHDD